MSGVTLHTVRGKKSVWFRRKLKYCIRSAPKTSATYRTYLLLYKVVWDFNLLKFKLSSNKYQYFGVKFELLVFL